MTSYNVSELDEIVDEYHMTGELPVEINTLSKLFSNLTLMEKTWFLRKRNSSTGDSILQCAARRDHGELLEVFLVLLPQDECFELLQTCDVTPLHVAAQAGSCRAINSIMKHLTAEQGKMLANTPSTEPGIEKKTPLELATEIAAQTGNCEAKLLLEKIDLRGGSAAIEGLAREDEEILAESASGGSILSDNDEENHSLMFTLEGATYDAVFKPRSGNSSRSTHQQSRIISTYINQSYIKATSGENIPLPASDFAEKLDRIVTEKLDLADKAKRASGLTRLLATTKSEKKTSQRLTQRKKENIAADLSFIDEINNQTDQASLIIGSPISMNRANKLLCRSPKLSFDPTNSGEPLYRASTKPAQPNSAQMYSWGSPDVLMHAIAAQTDDNQQTFFFDEDIGPSQMPMQPSSAGFFSSSDHRNIRRLIHAQPSSGGFSSYSSPDHMNLMRLIHGRPINTGQYPYQSISPRRIIDQRPDQPSSAEFYSSPDQRIIRRWMHAQPSSAGQYPYRSFSPRQAVDHSPYWSLMISGEYGLNCCFID